MSPASPPLITRLHAVAQNLSPAQRRIGDCLMEHFGEAKHGQIVEHDGILPHCDEGECRLVIALVSNDGNSIGVRMEDVCSIDASMLTKCR